MTQTPEALAIAAFLARKNVTKVAVGTSSGITDRQFYLASQGNLNLRENTFANAMGEEIYVETVVQAKHRRASDSEALDAGRSEMVWQARMAGDMEAF